MFNAVMFILLVERLWQMSVEAEVGGRYQLMTNGVQVVKNTGEHNSIPICYRNKGKP